MVEILKTKLFIPQQRKHIVPRPRLVERVNAGLDKKLTLIAAPAGFGKTTLLSEWITKSPRRATWLFLDEGDNDPTHFWAFFIASLQELDLDLGANVSALVQSPQAPPIKSILTELINDIFTFSSPLAIVLDDYHFIDSQPIHDSLTFLIDHLPANMHLVLTSREDPPLPLARWRARDQLTEIRAMDLRFTQEETDAFLRGVMGLDLSRQDVAALEDRTEGWAVGLQLAGLSMQKQADLKAFIADFSGSHRHILDYLSDEVLQRQPEDIRTFLLQTSILDRLCGSLCDALTGRVDSHWLLEKLETANLFIIPLDNERRWYRYHHLFADLLHSQLTRSQPQLIPELHRRASRWFEGNGNIHTAVEHALQAPDLTLAARLMETYALPKIYQGEIAKVIGWFDRLPEATLESAPMLCIGKAWALAVMQRNTRLKEAEQVLKTADHALDLVNADEALRKLVAGHSASIRAYLMRTPKFLWKDPQGLIAVSQEAQQLLPAEERAIRSVNAMNIGWAYLALADLDAACLAFKDTLEEGLSGGNYYAAIYGPVNLILISLLLGDLREALQLCDANIDRFNQMVAGQYFPPIGALYILKGSILLEFDHLAEAERILTEGIDLVRWTGETLTHKAGYTALARLRAIQGNRRGILEAVKALEEAWPESALYTQALHHRLATHHWPDDPDVQQDAHTWLVQSGIKFAQLDVIRRVDPISQSNFEINIHAAHVLACLAKGNPDVYPIEDAHIYLNRQQDFATSHGLVSWVVEIDIARSLLYQAAGKKQSALETLERALNEAAYTGLFRIFVDEGKPLRALLLEILPHLKNTNLLRYANHLLESIGQEAARSEPGDGPGEQVSEREREVLRYLAQGLTYAEIGRELYLSLNTVQFHVKNIYSKLLVNKRVQAIEKAREMHLI